jgi:hypothetical protein
VVGRDVDGLEKPNVYRPSSILFIKSRKRGIRITDRAFSGRTSKIKNLAFAGFEVSLSLETGERTRGALEVFEKEKRDCL